MTDHDTNAVQAPARRYTTDLMKTTAAVQEIYELLGEWEPGMTSRDLAEQVLQSGGLGRSSATRVRDIVGRTFAQRLLRPDERTARRTKAVAGTFRLGSEFREVLFHYTLRAYPVIFDFLTERYWPQVYAGHQAIRGTEIVAFLRDQYGTARIPERWSDHVVSRVARNLGKTLTDFGFFENNRSPIRRVRLWRPSDFLISYIAIEAHEDNVSDTAILQLPEWDALGLDRRERVERLTRLAGTGGPFLLQYSGELAQFTWHYQTVEGYVRAAA